MLMDSGGDRMRDSVLEARDLRLVSAIIDHGGVTAAARALHVTQSAASHQLRDLEDRLAARLFERRSRRMVPTEAGRALAEAAARVLPELVRAEREVRQLGAAPRRTLAMAVACSTAYHWLPGVIDALAARHPDVELKIAVEATSDPLGALLDDRLDLAVCHPVGEVRGAVLEPLFEDEIVAVLAPTHPLAARPWLCRGDLASETLLAHVVTGPDAEAVRRAMFDAQVNPVLRQVPLTDALLELVRAGQGVGIVPRWGLTERAVVGLAVRPLGEGGLWRQWAAYVRPAGPVREAVESLTALLRAARAARPPGGRITQGGADR
jgi:LysR family transcriptional regulator for metE and metH